MAKISQNENLSINIQKYFSLLNEEVDKIYTIASKAREKGLDPSLNVEIPIAKDIADRVEGLIGPKGVGARIRELEKRNLSREMVAFKIAEEICDGKLMQGSINILAEQALRTSLAVITESITAAPLEGIARIAIKKNDDGTDYLAVYYAGPIRSAGGTAAGMSVLLADFIRKKLGLSAYKAIDREVERYVEEMELYNRVSHLQLPTTQQEQRFAAENLTVEITGEPTDKVEVSGNRDLRRIETNRLRGGACLVFNDGIVGRAKKIYKRVIENKLEGWDWLEELIAIHEKTGTTYDEIDDKYDLEEDMELEREDEILDLGTFDALEEPEEVEKIEESDESREPNEEEILSDTGYIKDVIAGRPVFAHPSKKGGFRIRYGRSRTTGLAGMGIHPALMGLVDDFLACGTHVRTERPGKGAIVMPVDTIHPPIVKLKNGDVVKIYSYKESKELQNSISEILFLGDMLYGVGEFNQNNYNLIPSGYCEEWWAQELEVAYTDFSTKEERALTPALEKKLHQLFNDPYTNTPSPKEAIKMSKLFGISLHPEYTYHWSNIDFKQYNNLREYVIKNQVLQDQNLELPYNANIKTILEDILVPHRIKDDKILLGEHSSPFLHMLGIKNGKLTDIKHKDEKIIDIINQVSEIKIKDKCPTYTGARMGRPEKAKDRRMRPPVHMLFPIGEAGGRMRDLLKASEKIKILIELSARKCPSGYYTHKVLCSDCKICSQCGNYTHSETCPKCSTKNTIIKTTNMPTSTALEKQCPFCKIKSVEDVCPQCGKENILYKETSYPLDKRIREIKNKIGLGFPQKIKAVKKLMNKHRAPELLEKGILRAKHDVFVYRDGTIRFDSTDAILTHFRPREIRVSVKKLREIGYTVDVHGAILENSDQLIELKIQDVVLNTDGGKHLVRTADFVDELLEKVYGLPRYYNATKPEDLIGHIVMGLAPHTSAGIVGRIIGFTKGKVNLAHPYWHAAKRRNADGDEDSVLLALDAFLNFSRFYLPEIRGGQMDAPLILVANLNPHEVDDESHNVDTSSKYPLSFYESTLKMESPKKVLPLLDMISNRLDDESAYEGFLFSHDTSKIFDGPESTAYKKLKTMEDKVLAQLEVASKIRAVDVQDVTYRIVINHFIPDLIGNLRKFGAQKIRCTKCNRTYRRIPLMGICTNCKKPNLNLTVHVKSVKKYFEMAYNLVEKYDLSTYLKNRLEIIKHNFEALFGEGHDIDEKQKEAKATVTLSDFIVKRDSQS